MNFSSALRLSFFAFCVATFTACSADWPHALHTAVPELSPGRPLALRVVVRDARPPAPLDVAAKFAPSLVGEIQQLVGDPIPVFTKSGEPLANDIGTAICAGFQKHRWACEAIASDFRGTVKDEIPFLLKGQPVDRILYVYISDFYSEVAATTTLAYDLDVTVWSGLGVFLSATGENGSREMDTDSLLNPAKNAGQMTPHALQEILESILNAKPIRQSLRM